MLATLLFFVSILIPGLYIARRFKLRGLLALAMAFGLGSALISFELFIYFVIARFSFSVLLLYFVAMQTLVFAYLWARLIDWKKQFSFSLRKEDSLHIIISLIIVLVLIASFFLAIAKPPVAFDSIAFWSARAKILLAQGRVDFDPSSDTYLSAFSLRNYPWHLSLLEYWYRILGASGGLVNLISWSYVAATSLLLIEAGRRWIGGWQGKVLALVFVSMPFIFYHSYNNYADLPLAFFAAAGFFFFINWLKREQFRSLILASLCIGWTLSVKNEGLFYIIGFIIALILSGFLKPIIGFKRAFIGTLALIIPIAPWLITKAIHGLGFANTQGSWAWHPEIFQPLAQTLFVGNNWNIWWIVLIASILIFGRKIYRNKQLWPAWLGFCASAVLLIVIYLVSEHYRWAMDHTAISRTFIPLVPITILLISASIFKEKVND